MKTEITHESAVLPRSIATEDVERRATDQVLEVRRMVGRICELHAQLARLPDPDGALERELLTCIQQRTAAGAQLGASLVRWVAGGGGVELTPPDPAPRSNVELVAPATEVSRDAAHDGAVDDTAKPGPAAPLVVRRPASRASLLAFSQRGITPSWSEGAGSSAEQQHALRVVMRDLGRPVRPRTARQKRQAVTAVVAAVARMDSWSRHPRAAQRALMGLVSSFARHLREELRGGLSRSDAAAMNAVFSRLTRWSGAHQPGFVAGLSRSEGPETSSWLEDAGLWWGRLQRMADPECEEPESAEALLRDLAERLEGAGVEPKELSARVRALNRMGVSQSDPRLVALLRPHRAALKGSRGLKTLKTQLRRAAKAPRPAAHTPEDQLVSSDWSLRHKTQGKAAVIVGGDDRTHAADRIREAFGFSSVTWETGAPRRAAALAQRIRGGRSVGLVILLREFISHAFVEVLVPACRDAGVDVVVVDRGYGVTQVRLAMERFLGGRRDSDQAFCEGA